MEFFDSHTHYNDEKFDIDRENILNYIYNDEKITRIICAGYNVEMSKYAVELANKDNFVFATVRNIT